MKTSMKLKAILKGKKIVRIIKTLTLVIVVCVNCIFILKPDTNNNDTDNSVNASQFFVIEEQPVNSADFNFVGGK